MQIPRLFGKGILAVDSADQLSSRCGRKLLGFGRLPCRKGGFGWLGFDGCCDRGSRVFRLALSSRTFGWTRGWTFDLFG
jgi:hypothetical protein